jgi:DNA-binding NtrC family response regulator
VKKRILFVDDEPNFLDGLRRMLSRLLQEWDMCLANGVDEAESKMREMDFDAVVSDVRMPLRDGFSLLREH